MLSGTGESSRIRENSVLRKVAEFVRIRRAHPNSHEFGYFPDRTDPCELSFDS
jgi:hypothetical protein